MIFLKTRFNCSKFFLIVFSIDCSKKSMSSKPLVISLFHGNPYICSLIKNNFLMKTKLYLLICTLLFNTAAIAQTEIILSKPGTLSDTNLVASTTTAVTAPAQPSYCNYQVTSISGTCHNISVGDMLCKTCDPSGVCPPRTSCTKGSCTVNVTLVTTICTGCLNHGHHAKAWTCN